MANILHVERAANKITLGTTDTTINIASHTASTILGLDASKDLESLAIPLTVANGGSGAASFTDHSILLGSDTQPFTALGLAANGQIPIGFQNSDPVLANITSTATQITVTNGAGTIALSLPSALAIPGKLTAGTFASPTDVTNTREYGFEIHYSGNNYNATAIRARAHAVTTDTTAQFQGALLQAANNDNINVGVLNGALIEAIGKATANAATITMMRGCLVNTEWSAKDTVTDLRVLHVRTHTRDAATEGYVSGTGYGIYIENEAVGGNGQALDAGIYFKDTNLSAGNNAFTHGIDFSGGTYTTAEIKLSNGETISNLVNGQIYINGDIATDRWLNSNYNTFLGIDVCGDGGLTHAIGSEGYYNTFIGYRSGYNITSGIANTGLGSSSLDGITEGVQNTGIGDNALLNVTTGDYNTAIGLNTGRAVVTSDGGVFVGWSAGRYETASNKLYIDNATRTDEADGRIKALVYGVFDAATANQSLLINGYLNFREALVGLERSSDPTEPSEGKFVIWMSDGTGKGDDGDIMIASQAGGTTNVGTLFDHSGGDAW